MIIAVMFMLIFAGASIYLAKRLYNVTAEAADMRGFYDGLARRYEPLIQGRTAPAEEPAPEPVPVAVDVVGAPDTDPDGSPAPVGPETSEDIPAPESEPEEKPAAVDAVGAPDVDPDVFDALVKILESAGYELKALPNGSPAPADYPAEEKQTDDNAPEPARNTPKSKKTPRKPAAGRKGRKQ